MATVQPSLQSKSAPTGTLAFMLRCFRYPNYRLFFGGQVVSLTGTWISATATSWLVYRLTGSALLLGVVGFALQFPAFLLTPLAGIFVDRWNRHRLLVATQAMSMLTSFALAALTLTGTITIPWLVVVSVVQGLVTAFDMPTRQAFAVMLIEDKNDLGNAIALNSSMFNAARLVGPSIAGAIIAVSNEGWCFLIDGVSFLAVLTALLVMKIPFTPMEAGRASVSPLEQFKEGWRYSYNHRVIRSIILLVGLVCLAGVPYAVLIPVFAGSILHGGPRALGFLLTASGGGALLGALYMAGRRSTTGLGQLIPVAGVGFGLALAAFAFSRMLWLSMLLMVGAGAASMVQFAACNTLLQTIIDDSKRGRVMAFFLMAYFGTAPFGSVAAGWLSDQFGPSITLALGGACCVAGSIWFASVLSSIEPHMTPAPVRVDG